MNYTCKLQNILRFINFWTFLHCKIAYKTNKLMMNRNIFFYFNDSLRFQTYFTKWIFTNNLYRAPGNTSLSADWATLLKESFTLVKFTLLSKFLLRTFHQVNFIEWRCKDWIHVLITFFCNRGHQINISTELYFIYTVAQVLLFCIKVSEPFISISPSPSGAVAAIQ